MSDSAMYATAVLFGIAMIWFIWHTWRERKRLKWRETRVIRSTCCGDPTHGCMVRDDKGPGDAPG